MVESGTSHAEVLTCTEVYLAVPRSWPRKPSTAVNMIFVLLKEQMAACALLDQPRVAGGLIPSCSADAFGP